MKSIGSLSRSINLNSKVLKKMGNAESVETKSVISLSDYKDKNKDLVEKIEKKNKIGKSEQTKNNLFILSPSDDYVENMKEDICQDKDYLAVNLKNIEEEERHKIERDGEEAYIRRQGIIDANILGDRGRKFTAEEREWYAQENIGLVRSIAAKFFDNRVPYEDILGAAMQGYNNALKGFKVGNNAKFSTYAGACIRNEIGHFLEKESKHMINTTSLQHKLGDGENGKPFLVEDVVSDVDVGKPTLEETVYKKQLKNFINEILKSFPNKERFIIEQRYGLTGGRIKTQEEIGIMLNRSQANISKIESHATKKLKNKIIQLLPKDEMINIVGKIA